MRNFHVLTLRFKRNKTDTRTSTFQGGNRDAAEV